MIYSVFFFSLSLIKGTYYITGMGLVFIKGKA